MKTGTFTLIIAITWSATLAIPVRLSAQAHPQRYTVTDLGTLGGTFSSGEGINDQGWVNGFSTLPGDTITHAFLRRHNVLKDIGEPGLNSLMAYPFNERGEAAIHAETSTSDPLGEDFCGFGTHLVCPPFVWERGELTQLPTLGGTNGHANQVNNRGEVGGVAENTMRDPTCQDCVEGICPFQVLQDEPVLWKRNHIQQLPTIPGDPDGEVLTINDKGQAAGTSGQCIGSANEGLHAVIWENGIAPDMGNLGGTTNNHPQYINNRDEVVGYSNLPGDTTNHAFLWRKRVMSDLGTLSGDFSSFGEAISDDGEVGGLSCDMNGNCRAFLWQNGVMTDLNALISGDSSLFLVDVLSINSRGEIVGDAVQNSTGQNHAYLATPCDEEHADTAGCEDQGESATAVQGDTIERPKVELPENIRRMLRQRRGSRYRIPDSTPAASDRAFNARQVGTRTDWSPIAQSGGGKPKTASPSGADPVATLSPTSLRMFCRNAPVCLCTAGTTKLANTGNASLSITSITATGHFSETNACGKSLGAGKSCNISIAFHPPGTGAYGGKISVSDNASGSPQTASLTGIADCRP